MAVVAVVVVMAAAMVVGRVVAVKEAAPVEAREVVATGEVVMVAVG